jgi:hypothetical protein
MSTALGKFLIFNVTAGQACVFQFANRACDIFGATETGVRIDNCRNCHRTCNIAGEPDDLRHRQQPNVGHASGCVRHSRAADVHSVEACAFHLSRDRRIRHTRQHHAILPDQFS